MPFQSLVNLLRTRSISAPLGFIAMSLASLLAFHVGKDMAQVMFGGAGAEARAPGGPKPLLVAAPTAILAPAAVDSPFVVKSILKINEPIKFGQFFWDRAPPAQVQSW